MTDQAQLDIIRDNPIGMGLDAFHNLFNQICAAKAISPSPDAFGQLDPEDVQGLALNLVFVLRILPVTRLLPSRLGRGPLRNSLLRLNQALASDNFNLDRIKPLLESAIANPLDDANVWDQAYRAVTETTPPPPLKASSFKQTPWSHKTSSLVNTSERRTDIDPVLKLELGPFYVGVHRLWEKFFGGVPDLEATSETVFQKCKEGSAPLFGPQGWSSWPVGAGEPDVLGWFTHLLPELQALAQNCGSAPTSRRKLLTQPKKPLPGSTAKRKLDISVVDDSFACDPEAEDYFEYCWSHVLIPGELKSNPSEDAAPNAWTDLVRYAREVLSAQATRRFVLGFTLCGSLMRIWVFDRLGGIASEKFDINEDGKQFVSSVLGFLWMSEAELGFDPTIKSANGKQYIEIERDGAQERIILDEVMLRTRCIVGRATTCWKAHRDGHPQMPLVVKDSWQYPERDEEGAMLLEATTQKVVNVARHYHHETVQVHDADDDIRNNVRRALDVTTGTKHWPGRSRPPPLQSAVTSAASRGGRSSNRKSISGNKRSSSQTDASLPPSKRHMPSASPAKAASHELSNRVHRRVILRDYGKPIYKASSRSALLAALQGCIEGHESLHKADILHRDISISNLMINEDDNNPSWLSFLIDLDLAIQEQRKGASGAEGKTGTRAFMAIGALLGEQHFFMHDLESFFWVLFWICIHYDGPQNSRVVQRFNKWNYVDTDELADIKHGAVADESKFIRTITINFTPYYQPLIPWINRLRKEVFPNGQRWETPEPALYSSMKEILREARKDPKVLADG
ncbi:serine/threonine-protein kinase Sgk2 [Camillea tinctor]|nr:serine/threonine-protein kinase Sgk2 [Camillea tinctor]